MKPNNINKPNTKGYQIEQLIEKNLKAMVDGSITVIVQDNKPIQININQNILI